LLKDAEVIVDPGVYTLVGIRPEDWTRLLESPELSPRGTEPFMVLRDRKEVTLMLEQSDWTTLKHAVREAKVEGDYRLLTFDIELSWDLVGFLAEIARLLASAGVPVGALSAFSRDHILIKQEYLPAALKALAAKIPSLC